MESRRLIYYTGVGIITFATVIIACQGNKTKAVVIDPPASIAPMIRITDDPESGGMPCVNPEQFQRFLDEQTASEKADDEDSYERDSVPPGESAFVTGKALLLDSGSGFENPAEMEMENGGEKGMALDEPQTSEETGEVLVEHTTATALESDAESHADSEDKDVSSPLEKDRQIPETEGEVNEPQTGEEELEGMVLESQTDEVVPTEASHLGVPQESPESLQEPQVVETVSAVMESPIYLCHGQMLSEELQEYAYKTCEQFGISFYYPHLICQMYQESGFRQSAVSPYGDYGLMQLKGIYHAYFKQLAGIPWADLINDPYANIYCGVALIAHYWNQCHDLNTTISAYNTGSVTIYNSAYVAQVRQHESALQQIR